MILIKLIFPANKRNILINVTLKDKRRSTFAIAMVDIESKKLRNEVTKSRFAGIKVKRRNQTDF
jgi:hypothetical protein